MENELSKKLVEVIGAIQNGVGKASDFAVEQLPDIAQQYITYGRVVETILLIVSVITMICLPYLCVTQAHKASNARTSDEIVPAIISIVTGVASIPATVSFFININHFLLVWFAPKIYLIKGLASLVT